MVCNSNSREILGGIVINFLRGKQNNIYTINCWNFLPALPNKKQMNWKPNLFQSLKPREYSLWLEKSENFRQHEFI